MKKKICIGLIIVLVTLCCFIIYFKCENIEIESQQVASENLYKEIETEKTEDLEVIQEEIKLQLQL